MHTALQLALDGFLEGINSYEPPDEEAIDDFDLLFQSLSPLTEGLGEGFAALAAKLGDTTPLTQAVTATLQDFGARLGGMSDDAAEANSTYEQEHEYDRERQHNPRQGERQLNVSA